MCGERREQKKEYANIPTHNSQSQKAFLKERLLCRRNDSKRPNRRKVSQTHRYPSNDTYVDTDREQRTWIHQRRSVSFGF